MKKLIYLLLITLICPITTFAKTIVKEEAEDITKDASISVSVTQEQLDNLKYAKKDENIVLNKNTKTIATTVVYDKFHNIVETRNKELTPAEEIYLQKNKNVHILADGKLHNLDTENSINSDPWYHETSSKTVTISYEYKNGIYNISLENKWKTNPKVHSFDIIAVKWSYHKDTSDYTVTGKQTPKPLNPVVEYNESKSKDNIVKQNFGTGISQNLFDDYAPYTNTINVQSTKNFGLVAWGTYQHATSDITLAKSKSYTITNEGLGGILKHDYANYYDGMQGVFKSR